MKRAGFALALTASWLALLLWAAHIDPRSPLGAATERSFPGSRFHAVFGSANAQGQQLRVTAAAKDFSALQSTALADFAASDFPILRYHFADFPRTLELALVFRVAENPDDVQTIFLPWPDVRESTFDLSRTAAWKGTVIELGFAQFPTAQLVPPAAGFRPFTLLSAQLESRSWSGLVAAMVSSWCEQRPWQLTSVNAVGPTETGDKAPHAPRLPLVLALALLPIGVFGWAILRLRGSRLRRVLLIGGAIAWLLCDLVWQRELAYKRATDRDIWGDAPLALRQDRVPDPQIRDTALHIKKTLAKLPRSTRVLISAPSPYDALRLIYHAAPLNVGVLAGADAEQAPPGTIVVRYDSPGDAQDGLLQFGGVVLHVRTIEQQPGLGIYAITAATP
ncbi:MAG: hypothetical protein ABIO74_02910 [Dokdonella sp.]